ncbi:MAG: ABC transporter transmembrane domain-containing protein, partial [Acidobacteriota bacterium]|nr:ABC transporter transmembrane domain-containing protein [Acidobacteriota bacterium]
MADETKKAAGPTAPPAKHDDDVVGKVYDSRLMRRLITYLGPYKLQVATALAAILVNSVSAISGPYFVKVAVDAYLAPSGTISWLGRHLSRNPSTGISEIGALYLAALSITFLLEFLQTYIMQWTGQKIMFDLRRQIFRHIQSMHVAFFDRNPVGRLVTRVTSDVDALNEMFTSGVLAIFDDVFSLTWIVAIMLWMNWPLALLTLSVIPAILIATKFFRDHVRDSYRRQRAATAKINAFTQEYVSGMSVVQLFNREQRAFNDFSAVNHENKLAWTDAIFAYALYYPVVELLSSIAIALVIWRGGIGVLHAAAAHLGAPFIASSSGAMSGIPLHPVVTIGILIAFIQYAQRFFRPIQDLSDKYNILQSAMAAAERVFKLLDTPAEIVSPSAPVIGDGSGSIEFRNVWFTYQQLTPEQTAALHTLNAATKPGGPSSAMALLSPKVGGTASTSGILDDIEWILRGVSFTISPDQTAAIVGHTGAGKTTITALMMRFYDVQSGQVLIDGVDVREQDLLTLRRRFGVVLQDPFLFSGTIAQN